MKSRLREKIARKVAREEIGKKVTCVSNSDGTSFLSGLFVPIWIVD